MATKEYDEILASLQQIVQQAYALGRTEALRQVVDVLQADPTPPKPLALMAPVPTPPSAPVAPEPQPQVMAVPVPHAPMAKPGRYTDDTASELVVREPWWARPPRTEGTRPA